MKKIVSILICFTVSIMWATAQETTEQKLLKEYEKNIESLETLTKNLKHQVDSLQTVIVQLTNDTTKLSNNLRKVQKDTGKYLDKKEKAEVERDKFKQKCDSLEKLLKNHPAWTKVKQLQKDSVKLSTLLAEAKSMNDSIIAKKDSVIISFQKELAQMQDFKVQFIASLAKGVNDKWLKCSFAELQKREQELKEDLELYKMFRTEKGVAKAYDDLNTLSHDLQVYLRTQEILNDGTYNFIEVDKLITDTKEIASDPINETHRTEISELNEKLCDYTDAVKYFKYMIADINGVLSKDIEKIKNRIENRFESEVEWFQSIPWLKKMYDNYIEEIERDLSNTDPQKQGTVANIIYELKTE